MSDGRRASRSVLPAFSSYGRNLPGATEPSDDVADAARRLLAERLLSTTAPARREGAHA